MRMRTIRTAGKPQPLGSTGLGLTYYYREPRTEQCLDELHKGPPFKHGGPLTIQKISYSHSPSATLSLTGIGVPRRTYNGAFCVSTWSNSFPVGTDPDGPPVPSAAAFTATATGIATKAWHKFKPGNPRASTGQAIAELHQIPVVPIFLKGNLLERLRYLRNRGLILKTAGSEYLNLEFGWFPFLKDLRDFVKLSIDIDNHLKQLRRDNGKMVRRRGSVSDNVSNSSTVGAVSLYPILTNEFYPNPAVPFQPGGSSTTITENHWFSAKFQYWIPDIESPNWESRAKRILYDVNITPKLVWELTPWSWLYDWFSNVGDMIHNQTQNAAENLVAKYAYLMSTQVKEETINGVGVMQSVYPSTVQHSISASVTRTTTFKLRSAASPYGFGTLPAALNVRQALILSALGLSRRW